MLFSSCLIPIPQTLFPVQTVIPIPFFYSHLYSSISQLQKMYITMILFACPIPIPHVQNGSGRTPLATHVRWQTTRLYLESVWTPSPRRH